MPSYADKLRDPRWQKLRLKVMERDSFQCQCCGDKESTLNIHHLKYTKQPWDAPIGDLETLCEKCHKEREDTNSKFRLMPSFDVNNNLSAIIDMDKGILSDLHSIGYLISEIRKTADIGRKYMLTGMLFTAVSRSAKIE